jgi:hypothetical protein
MRLIRATWPYHCSHTPLPCCVMVGCSSSKSQDPLMNKMLSIVAALSECGKERQKFVYPVIFIFMVLENHYLFLL